MMRRTYSVVTATAALLLPLMAHAGGFDALRCEALAMRKEGQLYECLGRCERRNERRLDRSTIEGAARLADCQLDCEARFDEAMDRLDGRDICDISRAELDANRCHGRLLRVGATRLVCQSQCTTRTGGDSAACLTACAEQCRRSSDRVLAKAFCVGYAGPDMCSAPAE